jgi:hypothetical protein
MFFFKKKEIFYFIVFLNWTFYLFFASTQVFNKFVAQLSPKERSPFFGPFLKFGQAIVDEIFVQKISNF